MKFLTSTAIVSLLVASPLLALDSTSFMEPSALEETLKKNGANNELLILDTRSNYKGYIKAHVPTARHLNFATLRGTDENGVPVQYLPDDLTSELLRRAGVRKDQPTLVYAGSQGDDILSASMVAYVLEKFGVKSVKILDGGLDAYLATAEGSRDYPVIPKGNISDKSIDNSIGIAVDELVKKNKKGDIVLIDARPPVEYLGNDDIWPRQGHIPGAHNIPWQTVVEKSNTHKFKEWSSVKDTFEKIGATANKEIVVYCGTSREGSLLRYYLTHEADYKNVRLYEGSWKEYSSIKKLPIEKGLGKISKASL